MKSKVISSKFLTITAAIVSIIAAVTASSACNTYIYQPRTPKCLSK